MLAHQTQKNLLNAREYFREHLQIDDYYSAGKQVAGQWFGCGAQRLGLAGRVTEEPFLRLCDNQDPSSGERLTMRMKSIGTRRIFEDFVFSPPKSVSIAALIGGDERIVAAHRTAVKEALAELEQLAGCRIRKGKTADKDRPTGNIVAAAFEHDTSRLLDPQLHTHCIVFNATWDQTEKRWKALQNYGMLREQRYVTEVYRNRLAAELSRLGYSLEQQKNGFEIQGVSKELCERFSKRREQIEAIASSIAVEKAGSNIHEIRSRIAHRIRDRKIQNISREELLRLWNQQLSVEEKEQIGSVRPAAGREQVIPQSQTKEALAWSIEHLLERKSAVRERELFAEALAHHRGEVNLKELRRLSDAEGLLRTSDGELTTHAVLEKEWEIVCWAKEGKGASAPLHPEYRIPQGSTLTEEQQAAVHYLLSRPDEVMIFRGGAGTGKSFTLQELTRGLDAAGHKVVVIAPQRKQVIALQEDGFTQTETVAAFLQRRQLTSGSVLIVDEAGLLSVQQMHALMRLVRTKDSALIFSGDTRQHSGVEAGDALRALEQYSGIGWVSLESIQRQKEWAMHRQYRQAVQAISEGRIEEGFRRLARAGAVVEQPMSSRYDALAEDFLSMQARGQSCLVVSPTWREIRLTTEAIRKALISSGRLGAERQEVEALESLDLSEAQKAGGAQYYESGCQLVFHRRCGAIRRNALLGYARHDGANIIAVDESGKERKITADHTPKFTVVRKHQLEIRPGEWLLIQANSESSDGRKLSNGELVQVGRVEERGVVELTDGREIPAGFRRFTYGYAVTSHASQGLTVDHVLLAMDSQSGAAVNQKQFYVSVSRGREEVRIYTDDAEALQEQVRRSGERPLALEILKASRRLRMRPEILARLVRRPMTALQICAHMIGLRQQIAVFSPNNRHTQKQEIRLW